MARIRTREDCLAAIQAESAWRKKEIVALRSSVDTATELQSVLRRASVVMMYAHWEGFVKQSSLMYIQLVNDLIQRQQITLCDHFQHLMVWISFKRKGDHPFLRNPVPLINVLKQGTIIPEPIPLELVDTEDNLKSKVLKKIVNILDVDYDLFSSREKLIDSSLLGRRNKIAHGERLELSYEDYVEIDGEIRTLLEDYQNCIENCIQKELYRKFPIYEG